MNRRSGLTEEGFNLGFLAVIACGLLFLFCSNFAIRAIGGINLEYSEGTRSGVIQKFSRKGVMWKTHEGELNLGYNQSSSDSDGRQTIAPAIFEFSCSSPEVATQIAEAEGTGKRVTLHYKQYLIRGYAYGQTSYDIVSVKTGKAKE